MKLKKLLKGIENVRVIGSQEIDITGLTSHSHSVAPGNLFVAKKGFKTEGVHFIKEAISAGAAAILTDTHDPFITEATQLIHPDPVLIESLLATHFYEAPSDHLFLVGITGTNGKTTTSFLVRHFLEKQGIACGLIGTVEWIVGKHVLQASRTTPDVITNHKLLHDMHTSGCTAAVMEVSSHALEQGRVQNLEFDVALFTNLTQDHLDYHKDMHHYSLAKEKLFSSLGVSAHKPYAKVAVINADSSYAQQYIEATKNASIISYGIDAKSDLQATNLVLNAHGIEFTASYKGVSVRFISSLIGRFNVYNCLAAIGAGLSKGISLEKMAHALLIFTRVPGRLERIENTRGISVFVDYAHTEDALDNVLRTLCEFKRGRLITVFGCGGDRDKFKRPKMGRVAEALSDSVILTSDNPRNEDPKDIIAHIKEGMGSRCPIHVELDRKEAIRLAIQEAKPHDIVLIAGKGHESTQVFAHQTVHFDDRLEARLALECS